MHCICFCVQILRLLFQQVHLLYINQVGRQSDCTYSMERPPISITMIFSGWYSPVRILCSPARGQALTQNLALHGKPLKLYLFCLPGDYQLLGFSHLQRSLFSRRPRWLHCSSLNSQTHLQFLGFKILRRPHGAQIDLAFLEAPFPFFPFRLLFFAFLSPELEDSLLAFSVVLTWGLHSHSVCSITEISVYSGSDLILWTWTCILIKRASKGKQLWASSRQQPAQRWTDTHGGLKRKSENCGNSFSRLRRTHRGWHLLLLNISIQAWPSNFWVCGVWDTESGVRIQCSRIESHRKELPIMQSILLDGYPRSYPWRPILNLARQLSSGVSSMQIHSLAQSGFACAIEECVWIEPFSFLFCFSHSVPLSLPLYPPLCLYPLFSSCDLLSI